MASIGRWERMFHVSSLEHGGGQQGRLRRRKSLFAASFLIAVGFGFDQAGTAYGQGADQSPAAAAQPSGQSAAPATRAADCTPPVDPYKNYACLDTYLGQDVFTRLFNYYKLEWGQGGPPTDPNAPPSRRDGWPTTPETTPPMPYTEFPSGANTSIGVTRPGSVDSPLMMAIANTSFGKLLSDNDFQIYGWLNPGFNVSSNHRNFGNAPIAYTVKPNTFELDQSVLYLDRFPDTVQTDHIDWGMRFSVLYGQNYRYTNSYGLASWQFNGKNDYYGYDFPMVYGELWIPQVAQGLLIRVGRYISIPDIEAQLAPNNILFTHSISYSWDNYTNTGIVGSLQVTKNLMVQAGLVDGTETPLWHYNEKIPNLFVDSGNSDPLYPGKTMLKDPGNQPTGVFCLRYESDSGNDVFYPCLDGINNGNWGYNNLQWHGFTYYHKFNDHWHIDFESYYMSEDDVPNLRNAEALNIFNNGGTPFSPQYVKFNSPNLAYCSNPAVLDCNVESVGVLTYLNYTLDPLNNFTFRPEFYWDPQGWRTGTGGYTQYVEFTLGWQHWLSPQIEFRPEISYWRSFHTPAYNGDLYTATPGNKFVTTEFASDVIVHF